MYVQVDLSGLGLHFVAFDLVVPLPARLLGQLQKWHGMSAT